MTTLQIASLFIAPVGALLIAGVGLLWVRSWDRPAPTPGE